MAITVVLKDKAAEIVERQVSEGRYPDAESAVVAALALLQDVTVDWSDVDAAAIRQMLADADAEGGELSRDEVVKRLETAIESAHRR
jgi:Arc/MetJ-type ribon-helix-helix transcriptional regulator